MRNIKANQSCVCTFSSLRSALAPSELAFAGMTAGSIYTVAS